MLPVMSPQGTADVGGVMWTTTSVSTNNHSINSSSWLANRDDYSSSSYFWSYQDDMMLQDALDTWLPIALFTLVFLIGVPANALVIFVLARNGLSRSNINIYLLNLAVVDFAFLLLVVPIKLNSYFVSSRRMWTLGTAMCKLGIYAVNVNMTVSILTLVALAINRYNAVMRPVSFRCNRSKTHAIATVTAIWLVALASQSPFAVTTNTIPVNISHDDKTVICTEVWPSYKVMRAFKASIFVAFYCIPLAVVSVCYLRMAWALQRGAQFTRAEIGESEFGAGLQRQQTSRRKVARMVHILVLAFAVCMLPWHILVFINCTPTIYIDHTVSFYLGILCRLAVYLNSCLNPLLYSFFSQNFRANLKKSCLCMGNAKCRKNIFTPIEVGFKEIGGGLNESARTSATSGTQRSFTSVLTRAC